MADRGRVCIIGAGIAGLCTIKSCLEEGLSPVCFEIEDQVGGLWNQRDHVRPEGDLTVYTDLVTNTSKEMTSFSDFPFPSEVSPFMSHKRVARYLQDYATTFDLLRHVNLKTKVLEISRADDFDHSPRWKVRYKREGSDEQMDTFEYVAICNGYFNDMTMPVIPGLESFPGKVIHSREYRNRNQYTDKRVLVIGNGVSAIDIAGNVSHTAEHVYLAVRRGCWVFPKVLPNGLPFDLSLSRFVAHAPLWLVDRVMKRLCSSNVNPVICGVGRKEAPTRCPNLAVSQEIGSRIMSGHVTAKAGVSYCDGRNIHFSDGSVVENIDVIVCATGFKHTFPFLEPGLIAENPAEMNFYKLVWPVLPHAHHLAVVGHVSVSGSAVPLIEMQSRWVAGVFSGRIELPTEGAMLKECRGRRKVMNQLYGEYRLKVHFVTYLEEISREVGCRPDLLRWLIRDPRVGFRLIFGTLYPVQYRLEGPHAWTGARRHLLSAYENTVKATQTRTVPKEDASSHLVHLIMGTLIMCVCYVGYTFYKV